MQLTQGMYGHEFHPESDLFGLRCGQIRGRNLVHNGGWYNRRGEKLGWGDLSVDDLWKIAREIDEDELFIVVPESASFWAFVERPGLIGANAQVKPSVEAPGVDYIAEHARYIISHLEVHLVDHYGTMATSDRCAQAVDTGLPYYRHRELGACRLLLPDQVKQFAQTQTPAPTPDPNPSLDPAAPSSH